MVLPLLVMLTASLVWLLSVGFAQVRLVDAARETARAVARGDDQSTAIALGVRVAPDRARLTVTERDGLIVVHATAQTQGPGGIFAHIPGVTLEAEAVAAAEETP